MPRDVKEKLMEAVILSGVFGGILGIAAFVTMFVDTDVSVVLAILTSMLLISASILLGTNLIIKSIEENVHRKNGKEK